MLYLDEKNKSRILKQIKCIIQHNVRLRGISKAEIAKFQKRYNAFVDSTVFPQFSSRRYQSPPVSPFDWSRIGQKNSVLFFSQLVGVSIGSDISGIPTRNTASIVGEKKAITCWTIRINDPFVAFNVVGTEGPRIYINSSRKLIAGVRHRPTDLTSCRLPYIPVSPLSASSLPVMHYFTSSSLPSFLPSCYRSSSNSEEYWQSKELRRWSIYLPAVSVALNLLLHLAKRSQGNVYRLTHASWLLMRQRFLVGILNLGTFDWRDHCYEFSVIWLRYVLIRYYI